MYFMLESVDTIANHIMALYASKMTAYIKDSQFLDIHLEQELEDRAVYIHTSKPGVSQVDGPDYENKYAAKRPARRHCALGSTINTWMSRTRHVRSAWSRTARRGRCRRRSATSCAATL